MSKFRITCSRERTGSLYTEFTLKDFLVIGTRPIPKSKRSSTLELWNS